mmetsp:Transcript_25830/g.53841  ORF Transcript_25830/g.53841 Transcript_25830/m.53841 type:complete len:155 (-) Transcript_25830:528-992(-)
MIVLHLWWSARCNVARRCSQRHSFIELGFLSFGSMTVPLPQVNVQRISGCINIKRKESRLIPVFQLFSFSVHIVILRNFGVSFDKMNIIQRRKFLQAICPPNFLITVHLFLVLLPFLQPLFFVDLVPPDVSVRVFWNRSLVHALYQLIFVASKY